MESTSGIRPLFRFRLFVAGQEPNSLKAISVLTRLLNKDPLKDCCEFQIVDVLQDYQAAIDHRIVAIPSLVIESPPPPRVIVGSLAEEDKLLAALGLAGKGDER